MTITAATADALEALARTIFNPATPALSLVGPSADIDAQYLALIAPVMLAIDGRTMAPGFRYTLNFTNALQGRAKHWYTVALAELEPGSPYPVSMSFELIAPGAGTWAYQNSYGYSLALATCAAILLTWAATVRLWLAGNYPLAVSRP